MLLFKYINKNNYTFFDWIVLIIMILVCGLRYNVGSDYLIYYDMFYYLSRHQTVELIPKYIIVLFNQYHYSFYTFIFFIAALTLFIFYLSFKKNSKQPAFSLILFISLGYYAMCFNGIRQMLAAAICLYATKYIREKKFIKYSLLIVIASLCHTTALIMLPFYFFNKINLSKKRLLQLFFLFSLSFLIYDSFFEFVTSNITQYSIYKIKNDLTFWSPGIGTYINSLLNMFVIFLCVLKKEEIENDNPSNRIYLHIVLISTIFYSLCFVNALFIRIAYYFSIYLIFLIPSLIKCCINKNNKTKNYTLICILLIIYYVLHLISFNNMLPYISIFNK